MVAFYCVFILMLYSKIVAGTSISRDSPGNHTIDKRTFNALPEIREGESCIPGRLYKAECNTCRCSPDFSLLCTKMACIDWKKYKQLKRGKKTLRNDGRKNQKANYLPKIENGVLCKPGKLYRSGCKRCFCTDESQIVCSQKAEACKFDQDGHPLNPILAPEDVRPPIPVTLAQDLQSLHSAAEKCEPGKSYKVDCNVCICMESFNLLCGKMLCISYDDMHRMESREMSGKPCQGGETTTNNCKKCDCVDGKTDCHEIPNCKDDVQLLMGKDAPKEQLDASREKCQPNAIYKTDCNKCYCQEDGSLRCTQKTCLNYSQVSLLEKQRQYLEEHGL